MEDEKAKSDLNNYDTDSLTLDNYRDYPRLYKTYENRFNNLNTSRNATEQFLRTGENLEEARNAYANTFGGSIEKSKLDKKVNEFTKSIKDYRSNMVENPKDTSILDTKINTKLDNFYNPLFESVQDAVRKGAGLYKDEKVKMLYDNVPSYIKSRLPAETIMNNFNTRLRGQTEAEALKANRESVDAKNKNLISLFKKGKSSGKGSSKKGKGGLLTNKEVLDLRDNSVFGMDKEDVLQAAREIKADPRYSKLTEGMTLNQMFNVVALLDNDDELFGKQITAWDDEDIRNAINTVKSKSYETTKGFDLKRLEKYKTSD